MIKYLKSVRNVVNQFAQIDKHVTPAYMNHYITTSVGSEWDPLILALALMMCSMPTDDLQALLLQEEAQHNFTIANKQST